MVSLICLAFGCALGLGAGFVGGHGYARRLIRYRDPQLHGGRWNVVGMVNGNVTWVRHGSTAVDRDILHLQGECEPVFCDIGRGLSHTDTCACGKKRYGVFGSWR